MKILRSLTILAVAATLADPCLPGQTVKPVKAAGAPAKIPYYIDPAVLNLVVMIPDPPKDGSPEQAAELAQLHRIEAARTADEVGAARVDEAAEKELIFAFRNVLGAGFTAEAVPLTAELGAHVKNEQGVAGAALKKLSARARPYQFDATLHPMCEVTEARNSFPSGHAMAGYLEGFTLAEMVPERRVEILARADQYAHNRLICGAHYPSDIEGSRRVAYAVFGYMMATPKFQRDLAAARLETRAKLGLTDK